MFSPLPHVSSSCQMQYLNWDDHNLAHEMDFIQWAPSSQKSIIISIGQTSMKNGNLNL